MSLTRRSFGTTAIAAGIGMTAGSARADTSSQCQAGDSGMRNGKVFTSTNAAAGNEVLVIGAAPGGALALLARYQTFGLGTSSGLGSQGAVTLSEDGRFLFVVNAGSNSVSTFAVDSGALTLVSVHDSGGLHPISVAESDGLVIVLNDGGPGNVAGFRNTRGRLSPVSGSNRPLSAAGGTGPAQVGIGREDDVVVVTEKNTNKVLTYALSSSGRLGPPRVSSSAGTTPFGFAFDRRNRLLVSEAAASSLSSYRFEDAAPTVPILVSGAVLNGQAAACWAVAAPNGRFVYTGNAGTSSISQYGVDRRGALTLVAGAAGSTAGGGAGDLAMPTHGRSLSILAPRTPGIVSFSVESDGSLTPTGSLSGLPTTVVGLAAN